MLQIGPDRRTFPRAMGHYVLERNIIIKGKSGPRQPKFMETMGLSWNIHSSENEF